jgi:hypothetical protein
MGVKILLFPTMTERESFDLIRTLCKRRGPVIEDKKFGELQPLLPLLRTPGAEALSIKVYRAARHYTFAHRGFETIARRLSKSGAAQKYSNLNPSCHARGQRLEIHPRRAARKNTIAV